MKASIKQRLVGNFMLVILITVLILEIFLVNAVKQYYYKSVEEILSNQIMFSSDFYSKYFSTTNLEDIIIDDVDVFWHQTTAQVQILDLEGKVLMDSIGASDLDSTINTSDVVKAFEGKKGTWIGNVDYSSHPVIAISYPLKVEGKMIGILRFISSLKETNRIIRNIAMVLLAVGGMVILISGVVSLFLADTIVKPLKEVTDVAQKMANGQLDIRSEKKFDDEIGKLSDTLNYMAEELIKKEQLKNDFISSISHELRTPLTSIKGWAITLKGAEVNDKELLEDGLDIIEKESDRLSNMVEELLDFSRFVSGRITLEKKEIQLSNLIKQIAKQFLPRAKEKDILFNVHYKDLPIIIADENRIKQLLINLLDNAFKFTPAGGQVDLKVENKRDNILIQVIDNGCGISKEELPYIMEKFYKGKNSKSHSGLGLSICEEIVILHGGTINVESKLEKGTTISVFLPIEGRS
ncbi:signal transduction histidine kinase [Keratinibaculum paraultunense]|uniref:histidine kinase n=1 Tax=Keratinibaculum paraultunense TaxID=1278232 RepID=A0A4R3KXY7_9FIRM|nr:HAMP domain-containing sensor histidine kinase [Keratinibaculum paraultunense]QQY78975.1 HAMP domain-containing histidine kinase [Keratinibaculum paraultunense]TCS90595.1 signal transduction histidine kinase [Keratinibaculum paraultunense]